MHPWSPVSSLLGRRLVLVRVFLLPLTKPAPSPYAPTPLNPFLHPPTLVCWPCDRRGGRKKEEDEEGRNKILIDAKTHPLGDNSITPSNPPPVNHSSVLFVACFIHFLRPSTFDLLWEPSRSDTLISV